MARPEKGFQFFRRRGIMGLPRKGTETSAISLDGEWMPISTYPRKGTETMVLSSCFVVVL